MRRFCSYGPVDTELHYYVPRTELIEQALNQLVGEDPTKGGHYITVWAPRQTGKTWVMQQVEKEIRTRFPDRFAVCYFSLGGLRGLKFEPSYSGNTLPDALRELLWEVLPGHPDVPTWGKFRRLFSREGGLWDRPVVMMIDEVDTLPDEVLKW